MIAELKTLGLVTQIVLQFGCAALGFHVAGLLGNNKIKYFLGGAFFLMAIRRVTALLSVQSTHEIYIIFDKLLLPLTISVLLFIGLVRLTRQTKKKCENLDKLRELTHKLTKHPTGGK